MRVKSCYELLFICRENRKKKRMNSLTDTFFEEVDGIVKTWRKHSSKEVTCRIMDYSQKKISDRSSI